jgi:hypothetical protein
MTLQKLGTALEELFLRAIFFEQTDSKRMLFASFYIRK